VTALVERTGERLHFFPDGHRTEENNLQADLLIDVGFHEVTAGGPNYGPAHGNGRIFEHYINFRRVLVEESTFCAGFHVQWWEFPQAAGNPWQFRLYGKEFSEGHQIAAHEEQAYQGRAPHFWLQKRGIDDLVGEPMSRILWGSLSHLDQLWTRVTGSFDMRFLEHLLVAADAYLETRKIDRFMDLDR